jgi:hypothetical protein
MSDPIRNNPDFFLVGQPKSGTTALYHMLRQHPDIFMPEVKEPDYFCTDLQPRFRRFGGGPVPEKTLASYLALFEQARSHQVKGEASILYLVSHVAAEQLSLFNPDARIIGILREPASLLRSFHMQMLQNHVETVRDLRKALALEEKRRRGEAIPVSSYQPQLLQYSEHVRYVDQLNRYYAHFPADQILVLIYDDFADDNMKVVRQVFRFLGVDDSFDVQPRRDNPTVAVRSFAADDLVHRLSVGRGPISGVVKAGVKLAVPKRIRRRALSTALDHVVGPPPPADEDLMAELRVRFAPEVARLSAFLDRDLVTLWRSEVTVT